MAPEEQCTKPASDDCPHAWSKGEWRDYGSGWAIAETCELCGVERHSHHVGFHQREGVRALE